jgi:hypothetical protein
MEIQGETYRIAYDATTAVIIFQGSLRLHEGPEYQSLMKLFDEVAAYKPETITLQLRELEFLDRTGLNVVFKFVMKLRKLNKSQLVIHTNPQFSWQEKMLKNVQRLMPSVVLTNA